jgi:nucleotide-binding universal stress UspA family protein
LGAESKIPVLLLSDENALKGKNGVTGAKNHFKNILFPIVDPKIGATGFKNLLEFAKLSDSKVTLLYVNSLQLENGFGISTGDQFGSIPFYEPTTLFEEKARLQVVADWVKLAEARGVRTEVKLDTVSLSLVESVLKFQKDVGCDLIAFDSSYFDSYAFKHAIKNSDILECPIWISGPGGQSASKDRLRFLEERLKSAVS